MAVDRCLGERLVACCERCGGRLTVGRDEDTWKRIYVCFPCAIEIPYQDYQEYRAAAARKVLEQESDDMIRRRGRPAGWRKLSPEQVEEAYQMLQDGVKPGTVMVHFRIGYSTLQAIKRGQYERKEATA